jgi:SPP1 family predicted phage head-tail adaptor
LSQSYTPVEKNVLVSISQLRGDERVLANQMFPSATHSINMRWREGLTVDDRLIFGERRLNILSIENVDERDREYAIVAGEEL